MRQIAAWLGGILIQSVVREHLEGHKARRAAAINGSLIATACRRASQRAVAMTENGFPSVALGCNGRI
jgi:hypothetical protein